ncbi:MAG: hypothetical protein HC936_14975, partial [Leptolyngbyaceae cyanobacterium SU_3_3]|nr:hypothetical protein [Leptolyngbyaceae cyanobacterium SU_3_3]
MVYLPGVGDASSNELTPGEELFLGHLQQRHPNCVTVSDVFPYSAANQDLGGQRFLAPFWQAVQKKEGWFKNAGILIKIRNLWRFAISADDRYAPVYNQGIAAAILDRMNAAHPLSQATRQPIHLILIGTSGGVQVALGAVPYLDKSLKPKLSVGSVGAHLMVKLDLILPIASIICMGSAIGLITFRSCYLPPGGLGQSVRPSTRLDSKDATPPSTAATTPTTAATATLAQRSFKGRPAILI